MISLARGWCVPAAESQVSFAPTTKTPASSKKRMRDSRWAVTPAQNQQAKKYQRNNIQKKVCHNQQQSSTQIPTDPWAISTGHWWPKQGTESRHMFKGSVARSYGRQLQGTPLASEGIRRDLKWNLSISSMVRSPQIYSWCTSKKVKVVKFTSNNGHRSRFAINIGLKQLI